MNEMDDTDLHRFQYKVMLYIIDIYILRGQLLLANAILERAFQLANKFHDSIAIAAFIKLNMKIFTHIISFLRLQISQFGWYHIAIPVTKGNITEAYFNQASYDEALSVSNKSLKIM